MGVTRAALPLLLALVACAGKDQRAGGDPRRDGGDASAGPVAPGALDAAPVTPPGTVAPYLLAAASADGGVVGGGAINVRVEWKDAPVAVRRSPGRDPCGAPRPPFAEVHTLHGVRDVVVWIDGIARGKAPPAEAPAQLSLRACRLVPAVQIAARADASLQLRSYDDRRVAATLAWVEAPGAEPVTVAHAELPVVGHEIAAALRPWAVRVTSDASGADAAAWVIVPPHPYVALTDEAGAAVLADVPAGTYTVRGWLRPGTGQAAREASGEVTIAAGGTVDVTLSIAGAP